MNKEVREVRNLALRNKKDISWKPVDIECPDEYTMRISGVGSKAIRLALFVSYEDILQYKDERVIEKMLWKKINKIYGA